MILSQVAQMYDPIGLAAAFIVKAKIDVPDLPPAIQRKCISHLQEMKELENVSFQRCFTCANRLEAPALFVYPDASQEASGTCVYVNQKRSNDVYNLKFIAAKSRVPPTHVYVYFFTDSTITLAWIQTPLGVHFVTSNFKPFVSSRI